MSTDSPVRVVIVGAAGRMGKEALKALNAPPEIEIVGAVVRSQAGVSAQALAGPTAVDLVLESDLAAVLARTKPDVLVDLSHHSVAVSNARLATEVGTHVVIGCTGMEASELSTIDELVTSAGVAAIYAPNFAIGAILMMRFAEIAAKWIPDVEIIEMHHDRKEDAPSGTAMHTADLIIAARTGTPTEKPKTLYKLEGARGGEKEGVHVHSVRLPGLLAHQQVIFGAPGEVLTIRHDAMDRSVYMGGLKLCVRRVSGLRGLVIGLDKLLFE